MNRYESMNWKWKLTVGAAAIAVSVGLLEVVADRMSHPDAAALAARQRVIAAQAEQADKMRALERGEFKAAEISASGRL